MRNGIGTSFLLLTLVLPSPGAAAQETRWLPKDDPAKEWCYLAQSTTVIGLPFVPRPVQVTYDGAIFTGSAELFFLYGSPLRPVLVRQKTFLQGWIPVIEASFREGPVLYELEIFSAPLAPRKLLGSDNLVQFVRYRMTNKGSAPAEGVLAACARGSAGFYRKGRPPEDRPGDTFSMEGGGLFKKGRLIFTFPAGAERFAVPGEPYRGPFQAADFKITSRAERGLVVYRKKLAPGESFAAFFKMPRVPVKDPAALEAIRKADYETNRERIVRFWKNFVEGEVRFLIPEKRVQDAAKASLVHLILATRGRGGKHRRQGSGLPYDGLFLNDYFDMRAAYDVFGLPDFVEINIPFLEDRQQEDGMFVDRSLSHGRPILTSHGQALYSLAHHYLMTRSRKYADRVYPMVKKAAEWILREHESHENGLLRPSIPYDNEMIKGCYTSHNLLALLGLRAAIRMARDLGKEADVKAWTKGHDSYEKAVLRAIDWTVKHKGYVAPGLYEYLVGPAARKGFARYRTDQDWENDLLVWPTEVLSPDDPRVLLTLETIRRRKYREGCMTYRCGMHIHQYITLNQAEQYMAIGREKQALLDLYHVLVHDGSTHEGFENLVVPWTRTVRPSCPPPHAWAAAKTALFIRNMLVCEFGGRAGLDRGKRNLRLFSLISPAWVKPGNEVAALDAPTEMGRVTAILSFREGGARLSLNCRFHHPPNRLVFRIPWFLDLQSAEARGGRLRRKGDLLLMEPTVKIVDLRWTLRPSIRGPWIQRILESYRSEYGFVKDPAAYRDLPPKPFLLPDEKDPPPAPLSFDLVKQAYLKEYLRRAELFRKKGGVLKPVAPPPLHAKESRPRLYEKQDPTKEK